MKVLSVPYKSLDNSSLGILCLDSCIFRLAIGEKMCSQPMSIDFYMLLLFEAEAGFHAVDLVSYKVSRGTFLMVRPGQVQQWDNQNWPLNHVGYSGPPFLPNRNYLAAPYLSNQWVHGQLIAISMKHNTSW